MALSTKFGNIIPEDASLVSQEEALNYQRSVVRNWPTVTDMQVTKIFLRYGGEITFATTFLTSASIFDYIRRAMNVRQKMYTFLLSPSFLVSSYISGALSQTFVTDNTLLMKLKCPICNQMKFALAQCYCGMVFPVMIGLSTFTVVRLLTGSYDAKKVNADPKKYWKEMYYIAKGGTRTYQLAGLLQSVLVLGLPYMQAKELVNIMKKLNENSVELLES